MTSAVILIFQFSILSAVISILQFRAKYELHGAYGAGRAERPRTSGVSMAGVGILDQDELRYACSFSQPAAAEVPSENEYDPWWERGVALSEASPRHTHTGDSPRGYTEYASG